MVKNKQLSKRMIINKTNAQMVAIVAVASFVTVFCLLAANTVWSQNQYQARVTTVKEQAHKRLQEDVTAYQGLINHYQAFVSTATNVIGGVPSGTGDRDGDNAKIILDALPPSYDFPALVSTLAKVLADHNFKTTNISGTDDQISQQSNLSSPNPQPVSMPFSFTVSNTNYSSIGQLITTLQQSIRPIQIDSLDLSGGANTMTATVNAHTYYQPSKNLSITKKVVK